MYDRNHQIKIDATLRLTDEPAFSCLDSGWRRVVVEAKAIQAESFFPLSEPMAYKREGEMITLGLTQICDGYQLMNGKQTGALIEGTYRSLGWGMKLLGYFSLKLKET